MPTQDRFIASYKEKNRDQKLGGSLVDPKILTFPQNVQVYLPCWEISIFFTILRKEAP
jgi:hypothetical protein